MRFNLVSQPAAATAENTVALPLSVILYPSFGRPGEYIYPTDTNGLQRLLEVGTDLPSGVIERFMGDVFACANARLAGVDLSDYVLKMIGYSLA